MAPKDRLRQLLDEQPKLNLTRLASQAEVPYHPVYRWSRGQSQSLDADMVDKLIRALEADKSEGGADA